ncbi:Adhesion G protein-coupled receptor A3 [Larimichthys crocea]|uniref:Adhesion G protein-coupled receptor A3 n=2 Tax=Larimichthys crocea TaxID=215358 RepID=A0A6G0HMQ7_LARCR|nr:adhesion G protein-coupled receptor A1 [Larimichthys crocea]KAE8280312.1 Adhesion G protein-coupled receptor A3 [Larimichthys crocea]
MRALSLLCVIVGLWESSLSNRNCPDLIVDSCHCSAERSKELSRQHVRVKVVCDDVDLMDTLQPSFLPNRTVSLNLSNNKISLLRNGSFYGLAALEKLDLKNNLISTVEPGAFRGLLSLRRLDLSNNRIGCLSPEMFLDLGNLSKLNLSGNIFSTLTVGLFTHLMALKVLHFSTETLFCDCQLKWLLLWARSNSVRIGNDTVCVFPTHLHGLEFRNLREQQLRCDGPLEMPLFQLIPSQRQLVFRGDRLPLQCTASYLDQSVELRWRHNGHIMNTQEDRGIYVEQTLLHDCCLLTSEVILSNIDVGIAGIWECLVTSSRGNTSQQMEIVVLETSAPYCPADRVTNNKGDFRWPKTLAGILAFLPCAPAAFGSAPHPSGSAPHPSGQKEKKAWRRCDRSGRWAEEDYTQCPYASELTRVLHELTQITINTTNAQPLGQQLVTFTSRAAHFTDVMDVIFVTHLVERLTRLVEKRKDLGDYISDIASNMMLVEEHILWMAQNEARACTRIVQCVERIADLALTGDNQVISKVSANIALEAFLIRPSNFLGLSCTALQRPPSSTTSPLPDSHSHTDKDRSRERDAVGESLLNFKCHTVNNSGSPASQLSKNSVAVASIHLPLAGPPLSSSALQSVDNSTCKLQFIVFRNGKLFPCTGNSSNLADDGKRRSVSTPVAFTKLDGCSLGSAVHSVTIALRHFALGVDPTAAYWDFDLLDGHGGWRAEGCHITGSGGNTTTIHCTHHNNFAVLMDLKKVLSFPPYPGEFLHPVVYACTAVMLLCLFASIITYIVHHSAIRISRKGWHMLLNFCFHTALTFAVFAGGINRIKYPIICQAVGVVLHYSSLSTMLWLGVTARNIYKQVTKKPPQSQDGDPPPPPKQPLLRFYLVSGGVPLIICGVTAAVNIDNYGSGEQAPYCWMAWEPSLGAFFGPVAFIVLVTCIYFLCTFIQLRRHPEKKYELKQLTEEQQRLAAVDVPAHCHQGAEPGALAAPPSGSHCPAGCPGIPINPALLANEHSFKAQLRTAAFTLFLFLATWTFGALAVSQGHFLDMIFSCLYGAFSVTLGLFILIHHCAKRDDVWHCWCSCCPGRRANACTGPHGPAQARPKVNVNGDTPGHGHGHSHCHHDSPCQGKALMSCSHASLSHCKHAALPSSQNHVTCLAPVTPCCAALHSQQLMEEEPTATHVLLHADPEGYRPGIQLHPCLKSSTRTKGRHFSRRSGAGACGAGSEREYAYHIPSSVDGGSVHSSHTDSPHSTHERHAHICPHLAHEGHHDGHHTCHAAAATTHEALACHNPCHRHICCAKADLFPSLCPAEAGDTGVFLCGCGKVAEQDPMATHHHLEMHAPRRQSYPQNPPNQNGILKGGLHEGLLYTSDSTGNIRTGPWKNETTV